jgi:signal recognition particle subunit SRP54
VGFDGVVLSKLDGDARGGAALSVAKVTGRPVMFASNGEKVGDFDVFHPDRMASRILGMGDMLTLIEQAEKSFDADQAADAAAKLTAGKGAGFTLDDFLQQMQAVRKMGSLSKIFGMLPGMGEMKQQIADIDEKEIDRIEAIIHSMTPGERADPKIIDGSRRQRIARGSGTSVSQVNGLVDRFFQARTMMNQMVSGGGMPGLPGMGGMPGMPGSGKRAKARQQAKKGRTKRGSGNPAKRAQAQQAGSQPPSPAPSPFGNPTGVPSGPATSPPGRDFELPKELRDLL